MSRLSRDDVRGGHAGRLIGAAFGAALVPAGAILYKLGDLQNEFTAQVGGPVVSLLGAAVVLAAASGSD